MAQLQPAASQAAQYNTVAELMSEIAFQKVLLSSLNDSTEDLREAETDIKTEIRTLERRLRELRNPPSSLSRSSSIPIPRLSKSTPSILECNSRDGTMNEHPFRTPLHESQAGDLHVAVFGASSSTASSPNSRESMAYLIPSRTNVPTRKRSHSEHLDGSLPSYEDNKSQRTSPSPYVTGPTTPSTNSGDDDRTTLSEIFLEQQKLEEERIKREKLDEEFARNLELGIVSSDDADNSGPSAFDRILGVRPQASSSFETAVSSSSQFGQPLVRGPPSFHKDSTVKWESRSNSGTKREVTSSKKFALYTSKANSAGTNATTWNSPLSILGSYQDDTSSGSDSDIEIIPSSAFQDNGRHAQTPQEKSSYSNFNVNGSTVAANPYLNFSPDTRGPGKAALNRVEQATDSYPQHMASYGRRPLKEGVQLFGASPTNYSTSMQTPQGNTSLPGVRGLTGNLLYPSQSIGLGGQASSGAGPRYFGNNKEMGNGRLLPGQGYHVNGPAASQGFHGMLGGAPNSDSLSEIIRRSNRNYNEMSTFLDHPFSEQMRGQVDYIMNDPRKTQQEIRDLLENIRPDAELPSEDREGTPDGLKYPLYEHQKLALTWLKSMEEGTNKGGILADDMGLGKTISSLALLLSRPSTDRARKTTLIVGPVALVRQWQREIRTKINVSHKLSVHMIHGQGKKLSWDELRNFDVILTTYGTLSAEYGRWEKHLEKLKIDGVIEVDEAPMKKQFPLLGPKSLFYRVILDEAQCIKNKTTKAARAACQLKSLTRFCLTGTPMMNNVGELYSLIHFLRIKPYNEYAKFQQDFATLSRGDAGSQTVQSAMRKLQAVLKAILLRRTKTSMIDGKPIINLPPKSEEIQHVVFSEDEQLFYSALESKTQLQFNKYMKAGTIGKNYSNILVLLLRLRQCCCHPHLIQDFDEAPPAGVDISEASMMELARSLAPDVVGRLLASNGFDCPVCYDGVENPSIVIPCGHDTCSECLTKISDQAAQQNVADGNEDGGNIKCPTCRGKVDMKKIIDYAAFKKVHMPEAVVNDKETASLGSDSGDSDSETDSDEETETETDIDNAGNLRGFIVPDDVKDEEEETDDEEDEEYGVSGKPNKRKSKSQKNKETRHRKAKQGKAKKSYKHVSLAMLKKEANKSAEARRRYMRYLRKNWQPSAKLDKCVELLRKFQQEDQKTIIFSQFVSLLDLLQVPIDKECWLCERYDGSMNADRRNDAVVNFTDKPNCKIMLVSLKAGNAGLNLVAASRVIILDPFWNPYIEMQAIDRAYRIGQQRPVEVHRILIESTVEDRIIELQERKKKLVDAALDEGASKSLGRLDERQLAFLFGVDDGH